MSLINLCIYAYIFFKPFYLFSSGGIQISEIFIVIAFLLTLVEKIPKDGVTKKMLKDLNNISSIYCNLCYKTFLKTIIVIVNIT